MVLLLSQIAEIVNGTITGDPHKRIHNAVPFDAAMSREITFAESKNFLNELDKTKAGAVLVPKNFKDSSKNLVCVDNPKLSFIKLVGEFKPPKKIDPGISESASIGKNFRCGEDVFIDSFVAVKNNVTIGSRAVIHCGAVIGDDVRIGSDVTIHPNTTILERCIIGDRVIIHAGTVIGSDGFGFVPNGEKYCKIPHHGIVQIDDDVEIGAGNTIDRGTYDKTWVQAGVKTDNLVHIAHNVTIGENTVIVAQVGISGSVTIGRHVVLAGQAGIGGHLKIGDHATIGPQAGITKSVDKKDIVSGTPEMPHRLWLKVHRIMLRLPELKKKIREIEKRVIKIEKNWK